MKKAYYLNGTTYIFESVQVVRGELFGRCITEPYMGKWAWLYDSGLQFERSKFMTAREVPVPTVRQTETDNSYYMWGGELRDRLPHGARYYRKGR